MSKDDQVLLKQTRQGSHGDHWGAVFGFEDESRVESGVHAVIDDLEVEAQLDDDLLRLCARYGPLSVLGLASGESLETLYPALETDATVPVNIKEILEWSHVGGIEAQVRGAGRDTFALDFFATDYAERKDAYRAGGEQEVHLAGMAYVIEDSGELPENFAGGFCAYMPNTELPCGHDFNFIGEVLSSRNAEILGEQLKLIEVKLINDDQRPDMFNLPMLANQKNVRSAGLVPGTMVSGCFWLQGRLG